ncbi:hypothetical protein ZIOFF_001225 [Zingiber officinale]|uniref:Uncharacterized protein n=1 Tax=Zingiber officinale TaxID=94328 RepID=A0A8J5LYA8_ZINOF|nr:hypothetical protein ZIOFF_001225 [Zingiber officinale]
MELGKFGINRIDLLDRDLTALWKIDIDGKVNGAIETCSGIHNSSAEFQGNVVDFPYAQRRLLDATIQPPLACPRSSAPIGAQDIEVRIRFWTRREVSGQVEPGELSVVVFLGSDSHSFQPPGSSSHELCSGSVIFSSDLLLCCVSLLCLFFLLDVDQGHEIGEEG